MNRFIRRAALLMLLGAVLFSGLGMEWDSAKTLYTGIKLLQLRSKTPRLLRYYIMRIDLHTPGLSFVSTGRDRDWDKPMPDYPKLKIRTRRITTAEFMRNARAPRKAGGPGLNMVVAFNAAPWRPWVPPYNHKYGDPPGTMISNGVVVSERAKQNPMFVIRRDGRADIVAELDKRDYPKIKEALPGFSIIARNAKVVKGIERDKGIHPRTAFGLSRDRRYMYVLVVDGRQKDWSIGATLAETAKILIDAGACDALNMDGGGSSSMCVWDRRKKKPVLINRHDANRKYMRPVASNVGIVLKK